MDASGLAHAGHGALPTPTNSPSIARRRVHGAAGVLLLLLCRRRLLVASAAGLTVSIKLHEPGLAGQQAWLTFGRIRTLHLNVVAYGWAPMAGLGIALFVIPRRSRRRCSARAMPSSARCWNAALIAGLGRAAGINDGLEWLGDSRGRSASLFAVGGALIGLPLVFTLVNRRVEHLRVGLVHGLRAVLAAGAVRRRQAARAAPGVQQAAMNWWFGHNVLGLFTRALALASVYYFLPKVIGRPIQSYNLLAARLLGGLAFYGSPVGGHHLIGGPVPEWMVTLSIVQSMMMIIPVAAFTVNQYQTLRGASRRCAGRRRCASSAWAA